jgi:hypothetical protein
MLANKFCLWCAATSGHISTIRRAINFLVLNLVHPRPSIFGSGADKFRSRNYCTTKISPELRIPNCISTAAPIMKIGMCNYICLHIGAPQSPNFHKARRTSLTLRPAASSASAAILLRSEFNPPLTKCGENNKSWHSLLLTRKNLSPLPLVHGTYCPGQKRGQVRPSNPKHKFSRRLNEKRNDR